MGGNTYLKKLFQGRNELRLVKYLEESLVYRKHFVIGNYSYYSPVIIEDYLQAPHTMPITQFFLS